MIILGPPVVEYVNSRLPIEFKPEDPAIGWERSGKVVGGVVYTNYRGPLLEMTTAGEGNWLNKGSLRAYFNYPFEQLKCKVVMSIISKNNKPSRTFCERVGFELTGKVPLGMEDGTDAMIYSMTKDKCRWLNG